MHGQGQVKKTCRNSYLSIASSFILLLITSLFATESIGRDSKIQFVPQIGSEGDALAFSSDGRLGLTQGTTPNVLLLWDVATSRLIRTFDNQISTIVSASFSPNGMTIVLASSDHTLRLFDAATGNLLQNLEGHTGRINSVAFSPDGTRILSGSHDKTLAVWDVITGKMIRRFKAHENKITCVSFSPDGTKLISGSSDQTLKLWDAATGDPIQSVVFSSDGTRILSGSWDRTAKLWDARTGKLLFSLDGHSGWVTAVTFSVNGKYLLTMSLSTLQLWDASLRANDDETTTCREFTLEGLGQTDDGHAPYH